MDPISNVDTLVHLLRQRLEERSRSSPAGRGGEAPRQNTAAGLDTVHALAGIDGIDDRQLKRALIQNLLAERLGRHLINDAQFQQTVDQVTDTIESEAGALLSRVVRDLRASARA